MNSHRNIYARSEMEYCYDLTVTSWVSCAILWVLAPVEIYHTRRSRIGSIPWTGLNGMKLTLTGLLIVCNIVRLSIAPTEKYVDENTLQLLTMEIVGLIKFNRKLGSRISHILAFFWFIQTVSSLLSYIFTIQDIQSNRFKGGHFVEFVTNLVQLPLVAGEFVLALFPDARPVRRAVLKHQLTNPEYEASIYSKLSFSWLHSYIFQRELLDFSLIKMTLNWQDKLHYVTTQLGNVYRSKSSQLYRLHPSYLVKTIFEWKRQHNTLRYDLKGVRTWNISLTKLFFRSLGFDYILAAIVRIFSDLLLWVNPFLLSFVLLLNWDNPGCWCAYAGMCVVFINSTLHCLLHNQSEYFISTVTMRAKGVLICTLYEKVLRSFTLSTQNLTIDDVKHLITTDANNIKNLLHVIPSLVSLPLHVTIALCFLSAYVGKTTLICVLVLVIMLTVMAMINCKIRHHQENSNSDVDKSPSVQLMKKIFHGLKTIKLLAWEIPFIKLVQDARMEEMIQCHHLFYWSNLQLWISFAMPFIIQVAIVITYYSFETPPTKPPHTVLIAFVVINILCPLIQEFAQQYHNIYKGVKSFANLKSFMDIAELDEDLSSGREDNDDSAISIQNGRFSASPGQPPLLKNINLKIKQGQLVVITGSKHSGKKTLLATLLGEMEKLRGHISVQGRIAYVPRKPWICNATIKENILLGHLPNDFLYDTVIQSCQLLELIKSISLGDLTPFDQMGNQLTTQHMQQISLARAVFSNADVYLMEDFLSAMDENLAQVLYDNVVGSEGVLKDKTRILVTNHHQYVKLADLVVVMNKGFIKCTGPFSDALGLIENELKSISLEKIDGFQVKDEDKPPLKNCRWKRTQKLRDRVQFYIHSGGSWNWCLWSFLFGAAIVLFIVSQLSLQLWIDDIAYPPISSETGNDFMILLFMISTLFCLVMFYINEFVVYNIVETSSYALNNGVLEVLFQLPLTVIQNFPIQWNYVQNILQDLKIADYILPIAICQSLIMTGVTLAILLVIAIFQPFSCIIAVIFSLVYCYIQSISKKVQHWLLKQENESWNPIMSHVNQTMDGLTSIRAFKRQKEFRMELENLLDVNNTYNHTITLVNRWIKIRIEMMVIIFVLFVAIGCLIDEVSSATMGVAIICGTKLSYLLDDLLVALWTVDAACESLSQVQTCCHLPREAPWLYQTPLTFMWPTTGAVTFKAYVSCQHDKLDLLLRGITCNIKSGEKIGIIGKQSETDAVIEALFRLTEGIAGTLSIDGVDINSLGLHQLRQEIAIVSMEASSILPGTVRFNLDPNHDYPDDEIWRALNVAQLTDFVRSLPLGLHDQIQDGDFFSDPRGQGLLCLARAKLRNNRLVIIDQTSQTLHSSIVENAWLTFDNCTLILLSSRLEDLKNCDRVIVLDGGVVRCFERPEDIHSMT